MATNVKYKQRVGEDLFLELTLKWSGEAADLTNAVNTKLHIEQIGCPWNKYHGFTITGNVVSMQLTAEENTHCGIFNATFSADIPNANSSTGYVTRKWDFRYLYMIVATSDEEALSDTVESTGEIAKYGADGLSAYQLAVRDGFAGTEAEWLESLKLHFQDLTQTDITLLQKPATDKAAELENAVSDTTEFLRLADLAEEERGTNESERISNENARKQSEDSREQAESSRVTAENARKQSEDSRAASETERVAAEASRATAESGRATAESARETSFSESKTAADEATEAANDAAGKFEAAIVQVVGSNTDKVISQNALTVLLNAITDNAGLQGNVIAEAIVLLINEVNALKTIISQGLGDIRVTSITSDTIPQYRGQSEIVTGSGSPITNAVLPAFEGQIYIDTTNRNVYMCSDSSSATYWKQLN